MLTFDSGNSVHLHSSDLHLFKQKCFLFFQEGDLHKVLYTSPDRGIKTVSKDTDTILETLEWFWQVLTQNFAATTSETGKKLIFLTEQNDKKVIINCTQDFKVQFQGKPCGCNFDELLFQDQKIDRLWWVHTLDGDPTNEKLWLKRKELLASFGDRKFWLYQFSKSQRVTGVTVADMAHHESPISSIG